MIEWLESVFGGLPKEVFAALISMIPVVELRGGLPYAILSGIDKIFLLLFYCAWRHAVL